MAKYTALDDNANIYQKRNESVSEKKKLSSMSRKEKIQYFNDYYRNKTIVAVIILGFTVSLIYTAFSPKPETVLYAAIVNDYLEEEVLSQGASEFLSLLSLDEDNHNIVLDSSYFLSDDSSSVTMASEQKLTTYVFSNEVDIIITDEAQFKKFARMGYFENLSNQLPTDLYTDLTDSFLLADDPDGSSYNAYGIYLRDDSLYDNLGSIIEEPVVGIVANSNRKSYGVDFIRYLFELLPGQTMY